MFKNNNYLFFFNKKEDDGDEEDEEEEEADADDDEPVEAPWLGKKVRVEVEDMSLIEIFGESGVVVAASLKDKTVSFCTLKKHSHTANTNDVIRIDDATIARYTPLMGWRLITYEKIAMLMEIGMDSSDSSWDIQKVGLEVLEDHMRLWIAMLQRTFPALSFSTVRHQVLRFSFVRPKPLRDTRP